MDLEAVVALLLKENRRLQECLEESNEHIRGGNLQVCIWIGILRERLRDIETRGMMPNVLHIVLTSDHAVWNAMRGLRRGSEMCDLVCDTITSFRDTGGIFVDSHGSLGSSLMKEINFCQKHFHLLCLMHCDLGF